MNNITSYSNHYLRVIGLGMLCLCAYILCSAGVCLAYDDSNKSDDRKLISQNQYGPGWVMNSILNQNSKSHLAESIRKVNDVEANKAIATPKPIAKDSQSNVEAQLPLKKKKSGGEGKAGVQNRIIDPTEGSVKRGSGTDQKYDANGNLSAEKISGRWIVYAGFDGTEQTAAAIQKAIDTAYNLEGKVLVKSGTYEGSVNVLNGVSLYGGYDNNGDRCIDFNTDTGATNINGGFSIANVNNSPVEINGFYINSKLSSQGIYITDSSNITIANNVFGLQYLSEGRGAGICIAKYATDIFVKNNMFHSSDALEYKWDMPDSMYNSYIELTENRIEGSVMFYADGLTANVDNNVFDGGSMFVFPSSNFNDGTTVHSTNNNYLGVYGIAPSIYGKIISTNDYFESAKPIIWSNFTMNPSSDLPNSGLDLQPYNLYDNPLYYAQASANNPIFATQKAYIFNPYAEKIIYNSSLGLDLSKDASNSLNDGVVSNTFKFGGPVYISDFKQFDLSSVKSLSGIGDNRLGNSYINILNDKLMQFNNKIMLQDMILILDSKDQRTETEDNLLVVAKALEESSQYLDEETLKDFNTVVKLVEMAEDMKDLIKEGDFQIISRGLSKLVEEQHNLYNDYLKTTEKLYERLEALLRINLEEFILPNEYSNLYKANTLAKRKIAVDIAIERLKSQEQATLTSDESEALKIDKELLAPFREEYLGKLKMAITSFTWELNGILKDKEPVSVVKDDSGLKAMVLLDRGERLASNAKTK